MNDKLITALLAILLALGGWTLQRTFSLSQDMVLIKEQVGDIEDEVSDFKNFKKKKKRKKNKGENGQVGEVFSYFLVFDSSPISISSMQWSQTHY